MLRAAFAVVLANALLGCSVYQAATAPPPVEYRHVRVGETRAETISHLGMPRLSNKADGKVVQEGFEFTDGYNPATKSRIAVYIAGDLFTACLAEIIFWPIEWGIMEGQQCRATVTYDQNERVSTYRVETRGGKQLWASAAPAPPAVAPAPTPSSQPATRGP